LCNRFCNVCGQEIDPHKIEKVEYVVPVDIDTEEFHSGVFLFKISCCCGANLLREVFPKKILEEKIFN